MGTRPYSGPLGKGKFSTSVEVRSHVHYDCCTELVVTFDLTLYGSKGKVRVGHIIAYIIDKLTKKAVGRNAHKRLWVVELLRDTTDSSEVAMLMRALYNRGGARRPGLTAFATQLKGDRICHLDNFLLEPDFRSGKGIGTLALKSFYALLPRLCDGLSYSGTVLLSPGLIIKAMPDFPGVDGNEAEKKLVDFYTRNGFQVYVTPGGNVVCDRFIMGRTV